jgi:hypothetical protein
MEYMETKNMQKYENNFYCKKCDYKCCKKTLWNQHILTQKHNRQHLETNGNKKYANKNNQCENCGKFYQDRSGLWKHKKKCLDKKNIINNTKDNAIDNNLKEENNNLKDLIKEIMNGYSKDIEIKKEMMGQLKEQNQIIQDLIPKLGNNNNNKFNINVFLNEQCKDAINMSDFINSLNVQTQDLVYTQKNGLIEGISTVFLNGLKQLDIFQRPIHCTDVKREILYIKENNTWEKEQSKDKIRNAINDVAYKQRDAIKKWEFNNPSWQQTDNGKDEYIDLVKTVMEDIDKNSYSENKIIKSIIKETIIDK